jgi:hypothetical protein
MPVTIGEITSEVVLAPAGGVASPANATPAAGGPERPSDLVVRLAVARVLEILRREWEQ